MKTLLILFKPALELLLVALPGLLLVAVGIVWVLRRWSRRDAATSWRRFASQIVARRPIPNQLSPAGTTDWWDDLFPTNPHRHPPGAEEMLRVIAYDIACPRRLKRVAEVCLDYGVRVQKSVFECWLDEERFEHFWNRLQQTIDPELDVLLAYSFDAAAAKRRRRAGRFSTLTEKRTHYVL